MDRWIGKTAVVTGASAGIGAEICVQLANSGLKLVGLARRSQIVDELKTKITGSGSIHSIQCDITKREDVEAAFKTVEENYGGTHILVNNAGVMYPGNISEFGDSPVSCDEMLSTIDINVKGLILCTRHALNSMKTNNFNGHIINISSVAGHYVPFLPVFNTYPASKYAVSAFTQSLLNELAHLNSNIKVTSIAPGLVKTDMVERGGKTLDVPMLSPRDVADAVSYVLSTPPNININELSLCHVSEKRM